MNVLEAVLLLLQPLALSRIVITPEHPWVVGCVAESDIWILVYAWEYYGLEGHLTAMRYLMSAQAGWDCFIPDLTSIIGASDTIRLRELPTAFSSVVMDGYINTVFDHHGKVYHIFSTAPLPFSEGAPHSPGKTVSVED